jgi:poly(3-hydroxybutyrate) depolymerase
MVGSTQRTFIRVVHASYSRNKKHAVVIGYHGLGLDGTSPRYHHKWPLVEEMAGDQAIFIYPNALGGSWSAGGSSSRDVLFFDELVKNTGELYCIDKNRVFVHGFSNGSFFVNGLVALRKASIRGVISVAGGGGGTKIPAMIIHGTQDQTVSYNNAPSTVTAYARANGCAVPINFNSFAPDSCQLLAGCPQELPVWFCTWNGNHHWPEFTLPDVWKFISSFK